MDKETEPRDTKLLSKDRQLVCSEAENHVQNLNSIQFKKGHLPRMVSVLQLLGLLRWGRPNHSPCPQQRGGSKTKDLSREGTNTRQWGLSGMISSHALGLRVGSEGSSPRNDFSMSGVVLGALGAGRSKAET